MKRTEDVGSLLLFTFQVVKMAALCVTISTVNAP